MKRTPSLLAVTLLALAVQCPGALVPYSDTFESYTPGNNPTNFTELDSTAWTIVEGSFAGQAYQNAITAFSSGVGFANGVNSLATIDFPALSSSSFTISTRFRIDSLTLTGTDPANTARIGLAARAASATDTADRYQVSYILEDAAVGAPTGSLHLTEINTFFGDGLSQTSVGTLPVVLGEIYTLTLTGVLSAGSLIFSADLSKSGGGAISVTDTDSANLLTGSFFGYRDFVYVEDGGTTALNADFDNFSAGVPEPGSLGLLALAGVGLLTGRRRRAA